MKKYKLLYFVSEDEYFLSHKIFQAKDALDNKFDVKVICNFTTHEKKIRSLGFKTYNLQFNRKSLNPIINLGYIIKFLKITNTFKPDIIQCIALKPILITVISSFFFSKRIKIINCVVGLGFLFINKSFFSKIIREIYLFLLRVFIKNNVTFIFQNNDDQKVFKRIGFLKKSNSKIIYGSGVNIKKFKKTKVKKVYDLIFHSRILKDKGIIELIEALRNLKKKKLLPRTLVLGNPDSKNFASISKNDLELWQKEKTIIWKPKVTDVLPYIQKSRISILPSYREGLPKSLLEAASCSLPIISTLVPGCKEICKNNHNGFLVKPKDHLSLADAIEKLITNKNLIKKFGLKSREIVEKKFTDNIISNEFRKVYKELLK